ncbi:hypothetical protein GMOD_00004373 [Pyrenophora seminiperda CCB06]|uniref:Uncharacterized protein n=1 Tax=Pyrenophora seminiperda CCB06 TaxID=1302712 RepID=A0A3M7M145_9PLEO|nr:hypothetical protein GMOD_00004373 [Pyrenophora seminiperda CCB06]
MLPRLEEQIQALWPFCCPSPWCFASHLRRILIFLLLDISSE